VVRALHDELDRSGPADAAKPRSRLAGELAAELCRLAGGGVEKAYFCSSGSEGVETVIKFARLFTRELACSTALSIHGLTCGRALIDADSTWAQGFTPLLPGTESVPLSIWLSWKLSWPQRSLRHL